MLVDIQGWIFLNLQSSLCWNNIWRLFFRDRQGSMKRTSRACYFGIHMPEHALNQSDILQSSVSFERIYIWLWFSGFRWSSLEGNLKVVAEKLIEKFLFIILQVGVLSSCTCFLLRLKISYELLAWFLS